jgi:siroheme synthase (precorrin-2 oxidase/ferrochelatase)
MAAAKSVLIIGAGAVGCPKIKHFSYCSDITLIFSVLSMQAETDYLRTQNYLGLTVYHVEGCGGSG